MRNSLLLLVVTAVSIVLFGACSGGDSSVSTAPAQPGPDWNSYRQGQSPTGQGGKPTLVLLYSEGCPYCRKLKSETLADPAVRDFIDRNFTITQVSDSESSPLFTTWSVDVVPTTVILGPNGQRLETLKGFMPPGPYLASLRSSIRK